MLGVHNSSLSHAGSSQEQFFSARQRTDHGSVDRTENSLLFILVKQREKFTSEFTLHCW